ncbi:MAG: hypothetical protein ACPF9K_11715 [Neptuniibacter sp.]
MTNLQWFILAAIVIAALAYWNWQRTSGQIKRLQAEGFTISADLGGVPKLLVDQQSDAIAVVTASEYRRYSFNQIVSVNYAYDNGIQVEENFRIEIMLLGAAKQQENITFNDEQRAEDQLKRLQALLNHQTLSL